MTHAVQRGDRGGNRVGRRRPRRGLTLLEVLVAVFVLLFGLLAVIALVPVGALRMNQALRADRGATVGQCALEEVKVRGMLDPNAWRGYTSGSSWATTFGSFLASDTAFAIDPWMVALNPSVPDLQRFPYSSSATDTMRRLTLYDTAASQNMVVTVAERIFLTHDELSVLAPDDPAGRPYLTFLNASGLATTYAASAAVTDIAPQTYSWLVTAAPAQPSSVVPLGNQGLYAVSVVVFFNRDTSTSSNPRDPNLAGERKLLNGATFSGNGLGGGTVTLSNALAGNLEIAPNQWLLISYHDPTDPTRQFFAWYRVVAVGEISGSYTRDVTLAGPDWPVATLGATATASLFTDVVTVHTEIVPLK